MLCVWSASSNGLSICKEMQNPIGHILFKEKMSFIHKRTKQLIILMSWKPDRIGVYDNNISHKQS